MNWLLNRIMDDLETLIYQLTVGMTSDFLNCLHYCFFKSNVKS